MSNGRGKAPLDQQSKSAAGQDEDEEPAWPAEAGDATPGALSSAFSAGKEEDLGAVYDIPVQLSAVLGKTTMPVSQLLRLLVNNRLVARGEVVIVDDRLGVTMTEIIKSDS
jgi:flagellar motor switch protein FliN